MNIINSSSQVSSSNIVYSVSQMLNTTLRITVAAVAIAAIVLLGAFLLKACYSRYFLAKPLPNTLNQDPKSPVRSTDDDPRKEQLNHSQSDDSDLISSFSGSGPNTPYSDGPTTPVSDLDSRDSELILSPNHSTSTIQSSSEVDPAQLRSAALDRALTRLRAPVRVLNFDTVDSISQDGFTEENGFSYSISEQPKFRPFNRYTNILPWDHNLYLGENGADSNYVNASRIELGDQVFLASDAPTQDAMTQFWNMVWDQNVKVMVNLTETIEGGRRKADKYWIESGDEEKSRLFGSSSQQKEVRLTFQDEKILLPFGDDELNLQDFSSMNYDSRNNRPYIVKRTYTLEKEGDTKTVTHYHYRRWPDHGAPATVDANLCFSKLLAQVSSHEESAPIDPVVGSSQKAPVLVHCSAGVGRTGTFLAVYHARQQRLRGMAFDHPELIAGEMVLRMRSQRNGMIQSDAQFNFIVNNVRELV